MPTNTYVPLQTVNVTSASTTISFTSISQAYTDLIIVTNCFTSGTPVDVYVQLNSDSGTNYANQIVSGTGSAGDAYYNANMFGAIQDFYAALSSSPSTRITQIMNYANTNMYKTVINRASSGYSSGGVDAMVATWRNTAAVTSVTLDTHSGTTFAAGTTVTLYGIVADTNSYTARATGGNIIAADQSYIYHAFTGSGTFTTISALTADILVIAGGGGGGVSAGASGGGGAGGVLAYASQSLTATTAYNVIVGAGGAKGVADGDQGGSGTGSQFASLTASVGGGGGGGYQAALTGGSGGGGGYFNGTNNGPGYPGAAGTSGQGNAGGQGYATSNNHAAGGGGGSGATGNNASSGTPGAGGAGVNTYTNWGAFSGALAALNLGVSGYLAGGGGGGSYNGIGSGGSGGGGNGARANSTVVATDGTANTGSGGGGGAQTGNGLAGAGGSGLVIVRYSRYA